MSIAEMVKLLRKYGGRTGGEIHSGVPYLVIGQNKLIIDGKVDLKYEVLCSSNLKVWQVLESVILKASSQVFVDMSAEEQPIRFYKLQLVE